MKSKNQQQYYSKESIELLHKILDEVSPRTWHRLAYPYCMQCLEEEGRAIIANQGKVSR